MKYDKFDRKSISILFKMANISVHKKADKWDQKSSRWCLIWILNIFKNYKIINYIFGYQKSINMNDMWIIDQSNMVCSFLSYKKEVW